MHDCFTLPEGDRRLSLETEHDAMMSRESDIGVDARLPFLFIVGVGRSGTTLLRTILSAHSALAVVHESRFLSWMVNHRDRYETSGGFDTDRFLADLLDARAGARSRIDSWALDADHIRSVVLRESPTGLADAIRLVYGLYAESQGKSRVGDKTPGFLDFIDMIGDLLPEAVFVHLVRDGRDVALSMLDIDSGGSNVTHAAWLWARGNRRAQLSGRALGRDRYMVVRYEDLIADPEGEVARICGLCSLGFEPTMLQYFERPDRVYQGLGGQEHHDSLRLPVTTGLRDWRSQMREKDVRRFEVVAADVLTEYGYDVSRPDAGSSVRERLASEVRVLEGRFVASVRGMRRRRRRA